MRLIDADKLSFHCNYEVIVREIYHTVKSVVIMCIVIRTENI